ncbi:MAG: hypothetical protein BGP05_19050 [Rhizobiales bacterium 62-47]|nr:MAG: hypothetical protein BGP05_19050 [Rhizobiales bacterium 62-47]
MLPLCSVWAPVQAAPTTSINCQIRVTANKEAVRLEAVASTQKPASGRYQFRILKESVSGTSQNVQSGSFDLQADRESVLTTVILDGSALGHYQAKLTVDSDIGNTSCVSP